MARHLAVGAGFLLLAVAWTLPLALHLSTHLPGAALGDNAVFLWDFWWMRHTLMSGSSFFHTDYLFAPVGTDLTLHTHLALPALVGATLLRPLPLVTALNITTLASLALNGFCAYLLAWRMTRERGGAIAAGVIYGCSPFIAAHLTGHFNLITAWTIPLFALAWIEAFLDGSAAWAIAAGALLGATAYVDYYLLTYAAAFGTCLYLMLTLQWTATLRTRDPARAALLVLGGLVAIDLAATAAILITGGFSTRIGAFTISARSLFNPIQALSLLVLLAAIAYLRPRVRVAARENARHRGPRALVLMLAVSAVIAAPLAWHALQLVINGDYVTQQYYWRSAPAGIDVATLALGNPFNGLWGGGVREMYARLDVNAVESVAWPGLAFLVAGFALRRCWPVRAVRCWTGIAIVFFIWALGSHIIIAGHNTAVLTPSSILQFIPVMSNARMPGRAMVMVYLAMSVLAAFAIKAYRQQDLAWTLPAGVIVLVLTDLFTAPLSLAMLDCPPVYRALRDRAEQGAVAELPLGVGDGFGGVTPVDNRALLACQTLHERPMVGGFVSRLAPRVLAAYHADPLLAGWMRLSNAAGFEDAPPISPGDAIDRLHADRITFLVVDRTSASAALQQAVSELPVTKINEDERRSLYIVSR